MLFVQRRGWPTACCRRVRHAMSAGHAEQAEVTIDGRARPDVARRALDVTVDARTLDDIERLLARSREQAARAFRIPLTDHVGASCLRYLPGGFYRRHRDRDPHVDDSTWDRLVTVIAWLNSARTVDRSGDFSGGALHVFPPGQPPLELVAEEGTLVAFPSDWPHEVMPVTWGIRDVVVDWWR